MEHIPTIKAVMTPFPYSAQAEDSPAAARKRMQDHQISHLPVMRDGRLVGVIADDDFERFAGCACVGEMIRSEATVVELSEPLDRVLLRMAETRIDAVLVVKGGKLAGIFTMTDACRCFAEFLLSIFPETDGDDAA